MKKILICLLFLAGCGKSPQTLELKNKGLQVLCTTAMVADLVGRIGKEHVQIHILIQGELDPHSYELVKGDSEKFKKADIIFYHGLGLEHGASLSSLLHTSSDSVNLGNFLPKESLLEADGAIDPHVWLDVALFAHLLDPIENALAKADPSHAVDFAASLKEAQKDLKELDERIFSTLASLPEKKRYLVTSHDAFNYFARRYLATDEERVSGRWQVRFSAPEGLAPDGQLSPFHIQEIVDHLKNHNIHTIFPESNVSRDSIRKIVSVCKSLGLPITISTEALYGDSMGHKTYQEMMEHNARVIEATGH